MARKLADLLAAELAEEDFDPIMPAEDEVDLDGDAIMEDSKDVVEVQDDKDDNIQLNAQLRAEVGPQAYNYVKRLHKSLGHPQPAVLKKMLSEVQATENVKRLRRTSNATPAMTGSHHFQCHRPLDLWPKTSTTA